MKLKTALEIGMDCGLETVGESIYNIRFHAINLFTYGQIHTELAELKEEFETLKNCSDVTETSSVKETIQLLDEKFTDGIMASH